MKRLFLTTVLGAACLVRAASGADANSTAPASNGTEAKELQDAAVKANAASRHQQEVDYALAEVRKLLESKPEIQVTELAIDPDYNGGDGAFLVNAVVDSGERKFAVGVMVKLSPTPNGWNMLTGFLD